MLANITPSLTESLTVFPTAAILSSIAIFLYSFFYKESVASSSNCLGLACHWHPVRSVDWQGRKEGRREGSKRFYFHFGKLGQSSELVCGYIKVVKVITDSEGEVRVRVNRGYCVSLSLYRDLPSSSFLFGPQLKLLSIPLIKLAALRSITLDSACMCICFW